MRRTATSASGASLVEVPLAGVAASNLDLTDQFAGALGFASALSLPWLIDEAQDKLAAAVDGDPQTTVEQPR